MFGFSISKLVFTVLAVAAVWYGFKWVHRVQEIRRREAAARVHQEGRRSPTGAPAGASAAEDMVKCPACGDYVPERGMKNCGRADCSYPG